MIKSFIDKLLATKTGTYGVAAEFNSDGAIMAAIKKARAEGYTKMEAFTPFPIHGIDEALGNPPSILGYIVIGWLVAWVLFLRRDAN